MPASAKYVLEYIRVEKVAINLEQLMRCDMTCQDRCTSKSARKHECRTACRVKSRDDFCLSLAPCMLHLVSIVIIF